MSRTPVMVNKLGKALEDALWEAGVRDVEVLWEPVGPRPAYRIYVVSNDFDVFKHSERQDMVWRAAEAVLTERQTQRITAIFTVTNSEIGEEEDDADLVEDDESEMA